MINPKNLSLKKYKLVFDNATKPIIGCLSHSDFKDCVHASDEANIENLIMFIKTFQGFEHLTKSGARRLLLSFKLHKVSKGWHTDQNSFSDNE